MRTQSGLIITPGIKVVQGVKVNQGLIINPSPGGEEFAHEAVGSISFDGNGSTINTTISANDTLYPLNVVTIANGTLSGVSSNNDGSFTNNSGNTLSLFGRIIVDGLVATVDSHLGVQSDESGSWAEIQTDIGSWRTSVYTGSRYMCWICTYSISLSDGKSVRPAVQNDANAPQTFIVSSFSHHVWTVNGD